MFLLQIIYMQKLNTQLVKNILGQAGGYLNMSIGNVSYNCTKSVPEHVKIADLLAGQKGGRKKKIIKKDK